MVFGTGHLGPNLPAPEMTTWMPFWSPYFIKYFGAEFTLFAFFAFLVTGKLTGTTLIWSSNAIVH